MPGNEGHTFHCRAAFTRARHKEKLTSYPLDSQCPNIENSGSFLGRPAGPCGGKTPTEAGGARTRPAYKRTENMHNTTKKILKMRRSRGTAEGNLSKWLRVFVAERSETKTPECGIACVTIETKFQLKVHWKALDEIYKIYIFLHCSDPKMSATSRSIVCYVFLFSKKCIFLRQFLAF